jgi:hemoglobin
VSQPPAEIAVVERIGEDGLAKIVAAFYRRVGSDDLLRPMYPEQDLDGAEQRLRDFLIYRLGGSPRYIEQRGHPRLRMRHASFSVDAAARDRWMELMSAAIDECQPPADVAAWLHEFLGGVATFLINRTTNE